MIIIIMRCSDQTVNYIYFSILLSGLQDYKVNRLERYLLVWSGKYKSVDEVPVFVRYVKLESLTLALKCLG